MITKLRFASEYFFYYLKKYYLFIIVGASLGSLIYLQRNYLFTLYLSLQNQKEYIGLEGQYSKSNLPLSITNLLSYGLSSDSPLVTSLDIRDNNKTYLYQLNTNLKWHNGANLSARQLESKYNDIVFAATNNQELKVTLKESFSPIEALLSRPLFLPDSLIGLGPYSVKNILFREGNIKQLFLKSNSGSKIFRFYPNESDLISAFKLGLVDQIEINQLSNHFEKWTNINISQQITTDRYTAIFLNTDRLPVKAIRQALAYAAPKTKDKNKRCYGPISPLSWAYNPTIKEYNYNPTRAKELLRKNQLDRLTLLVNDRRLLTLAEEIAAIWKQIFNVEITVSSLNNQLLSSDYDAVLAYGYIPQDPDQYSFWHSTQSKNNITKLNNSRIDKLLEEGRSTFDLTERKKIYIDFQKFLLEESPAIFLEYPTLYTITRVK